MLMSLFLRLLARVVPLTALLCAVIPVIGGRSANTGSAWERFGFTACGLPCFAGITPGYTPFDTLSNLMSRHVPVIDPRMIAGGASINFYAYWNGQQMSGVARFDRGRVGELRLNVSVPLAPVVEQLGAPDCLLLNNNPANLQVVVFWQREGVSVAAVLDQTAPRVDVNGRLLALWLSAVEADNCKRQGAVRWHGFAPLWDYR
jgi:hypothetical protein